jgi:anti-sigma regulatory factor (Ser/Thr protein kinase)
MSDVVTYPCPCCGHLVFAEPPGSSDICLICFWEDDADQLRFPTLEDATNVVSLAVAQQNYAKFAAIEERFAGDVRKPTAEDARDPEFRPIEASDDFEEPGTSEPGPDDPTALYYFRAGFWRRPKA